jgi:hypothetical protein
LVVRPTRRRVGMRKIALAMLAVLALFVGGVAKAGSPNNNHGMCTAYFNGSETGQEHKRQANAFVEFVNYVGDNDGVDNDGDNQTDEGDEVASPEDVWAFCSDIDNNSKGIGGQPDDPNTEGNDGNGNGGNGNG